MVAVVVRNKSKTIIEPTTAAVVGGGAILFCTVGSFAPMAAVVTVRLAGRAGRRYPPPRPAKRNDEWV